MSSQNTTLRRAESYDVDIEKKEEIDYIDQVAELAPGQDNRRHYTEEEEAFLNSFDDKQKSRMYRKIDVRLLPMLGMLYLFACE